MTKFIKTPIVISLAFLMFSGMVSAQQVKIGFVNYGRLIGESPWASQKRSTSALRDLWKTLA